MYKLSVNGRLLLRAPLFCIAERMMAGRPSKFDVPVVSALIAAKRKGATDADAARQAGVNLRTLGEWLAKGRTGSEEFHAFARGFDQAVQSYRKEKVRAIARAAGMIAA